MPRRAGRLTAALAAAAVAALAGAAPALADDFYDPPANLEDYDRGDLIRSEPVDLDSPQVSGTRVMFRSEGAAGGPIAVTGVVVEENEAAPPGGRHVVAWGHGTLGIGDDCAPSKHPTLYPGRWRGYLKPVINLANEGYLVVAPDYEGMGTPGIHTWLHSASAGRSMLDAAAAAGELEPATGKFATIGQSQGASAAFSAAEQDPPKPGMEHVGAIGLGFITNFRALTEEEFARPVPDPHAYPYVGYMGVGIRAQFPDFDYADLVSQDFLQYMDAAAVTCWDQWFGFFGALDPPLQTEEVWNPNWQESPEAAQWSQGFEVGFAQADAPILIANGDLDPYTGHVPETIDRMCSNGSIVDHHVHEKSDHDTVINDSWPVNREWLADRFEGVEPPTNICS